MKHIPGCLYVAEEQKGRVLWDLKLTTFSVDNINIRRQKEWAHGVYGSRPGGIPFAVG